MIYTQTNCAISDKSVICTYYKRRKQFNIFLKATQKGISNEVIETLQPISQTEKPWKKEKAHTMFSLVIITNVHTVEMMFYMRTPYYVWMFVYLILSKQT